MEFTTPTSRWAALTTRNRSADGHFVYAVRTTSIYCRPSCAARLARRANVEFYLSPAAAAQAGYRACKRCKPDLGAEQDDPQDVAVAKACAIIRASVANAGGVSGKGSSSIGLNELAERVGLTPSYLHKTFKAKMGVTPKKYAETLRQKQQQQQEQREKAAAISSLSCDGAAAQVGSNWDTIATHLPAAYPALMHDLAVGSAFELDDAGAFGGGDGNLRFGSEGFSGASTSLVNTPKTTDWPWLDESTPDFAQGGIFDPEIFAQSLLAQDQIGWNDTLYQALGKDWELMPAADEGQDNMFHMSCDVAKTSY